MNLRRSSAITLLLVSGGIGCAGTGATIGAPSKTLVAARAAYGEAARGPAKTLVPAQVEVAKDALRRAEQEYREGSNVADDWAYLAHREALLADAKASLAASHRAENRIHDRMLALRMEASERNEMLARRFVPASRSEIAIPPSIGTVREEPRGTVILMPGRVLFGSNKAQLMTSAVRDLEQVAEALKSVDQRIVIEGHTDSRGSDAYNLQLSRRRAEAVRDQLVRRGVPRHRVEIAPMGEREPTAENSTAEGRAMNRRVEIVLQRDVS